MADQRDPECSVLRHCALMMIEDNPADIELLEQAFHQRGFRADIDIFRSGRPAWDALQAMARSGARAPDMILLDDRLPDMSGSELYQSIVNEPHFQRTIIIIFTSMPADRLERQGIHPDAIVPKPSDWSGYEAVFDKVLALLHQVPCALKKIEAGIE
jgi:CheY-like chemotaxis protein